MYKVNLYFIFNHQTPLKKKIGPTLHNSSFQFQWIEKINKIRFDRHQTNHIPSIFSNYVELCQLFNAVSNLKTPNNSTSAASSHNKNRQLEKQDDLSAILYRICSHKRARKDRWSKKGTPNRRATCGGQPQFQIERLTEEVAGNAIWCITTTNRKAVQQVSTEATRFVARAFGGVSFLRSDRVRSWVICSGFESEWSKWRFLYFEKNLWVSI